MQFRISSGVFDAVWGEWPQAEASFINPAQIRRVVTGLRWR
jgi:hypothetical protein